MNAGPITCEDPTLHQHMRANDIPSFAATAKLRNVYILARQTNPASIPQVGRPNCEPKPVDCNAKMGEGSQLQVFLQTGLRSRRLHTARTPTTAAGGLWRRV